MASAPYWNAARAASKDPAGARISDVRPRLSAAVVVPIRCVTLHGKGPPPFGRGPGNGGEEEIRTLDPRVANAMLYQLSYFPEIVEVS